MNRFDSVIQRILLWFDATGSRRRERDRSEIVEPAEGQSLEPTRLLTGYVLAVTLPAATAALMIPLRTSHAGAAALVIMLAVVVVAAIGTTGPAVVAAVSAGVAFDLFLTEPYYRLAISDGADITAAVTLVLVGLIVGVLSSRLANLAAQSTARRQELYQLVKFIRSAEVATSVDDLSRQACADLTALLGLRSCEWLPEMKEGGGPVLLTTGAVMGPLSSMNADRAVLPAHLELPVDAGLDRLGHLILSPQPSHRTSLEERLTAATIATVFAGAVERIRASTKR